MSMKIFKAGNQSVKFKALNNMLAGNASPHAVKHFEREVTSLFGTGERHELPTDFVNGALQGGKIVVLYNSNSWIITSHGPHDVDFIVLRHTGSGNVEYYATRASNTDVNNKDDVQVASLDINTVIHAIKDDFSEYHNIGSLRTDYKVLAFTSDAIYTPDWTLESLPEGWSQVHVENKINRTGAIANNSSTNKGSTNMSNVKNTATVVAAKNKSAVVAVAKLEAGRIAIKQVSRVVTPKLPMMIRGYADSEIGRLVMANLFNFAVTQFAANNQNAQLVADAMLEGAMLEMLQKFNFEEMINEVVNKVDISKLTSSEE